MNTIKEIKMNKQLFGKTTIESMLKTSLRLTSVALLGAVTMACSSQADAPKVSADGLTLVHQDIETTAYKKEGFDLANYSSIFILPSQVAFKKNWQRIYNSDRAHSSYRVTDEDAKKITTEVADLFDSTFAKELNKGPYKVRNSAASGTLILKPFIINLDIYAPGGQAGSNIKTVSRDTGEATLYLEVFDGADGTLLARIIDDAIIGDDGFAQLSNKARNNADTIRTIRRWAKKLNDQFINTKN